MIVRDVLDVTALDRVPTHSVWLPPQEFSARGPWGAKIPFQFGGRVQKYQRPLEDSHGLETLAEEYAFAKYLASQSWGPEIGDWVYYKTIVSEHNGARWADPLGAYGFEVKDAAMMTPGAFSPRALRESCMVDASEGAWSDAAKPHNIVNGYLVDTRRSWWDRLRYLGSVELIAPPFYHEDIDVLTRDLAREGSFPFQQRDQPYQSYYLDGAWVRAEREVVNRAALLGMTIKPGETVLDLGCCIGGFLQLAHLAGASRVVGLDFQFEFVNLARRLARANRMNLGVFQFDLTSIGHDSAGQIKHHLDGLRAIFPNGVDHLVCLSMGKHLTEEIMWWWVDALSAKHTYLETNAIKPETVAKDFPYWNGVMQRGGDWVGMSNDRNDRALYRIDRVM